MMPYAATRSINRTSMQWWIFSNHWLTTGPKVREFEGAIEGTRVSAMPCGLSGTSALHCAAYAAGIKPGDEVLVPAITFAATANCVIALGGKPVIVDVEPDTLLIDTGSVEKHITSRTKAIIAVEYAGQPCGYAALRTLADKHHIFLISDSCHALGARYEKKSIGQLADAPAFSFTLSNISPPGKAARL